jgi:hypothetical protein
MVDREDIRRREVQVQCRRATMQERIKKEKGREGAKERENTPEASTIDKTMKLHHTRKGNF